MKTRTLGPNGPQVSAIGLGCMGFSEFYTSSAGSDAEAIAVIQAGLALGLNFLDTADVYGPFTNEILVGKAIAGRRDQVFVATKFGIQRDPGNPQRRGISGKPDYVRAACEGSLKRLNVERIDLYYQHRVDRSTAIEETVGAMAELVKAGKVRFIGLSEPSARRYVVHIASTRLPRCNRSTRCGHAIRRTACCRLVANSASASSRTVRSAADFSPADSAASMIWMPRTIGAIRRAFRARILRRTLRLWKGRGDRKGKTLYAGATGACVAARAEPAYCADSWDHELAAAQGEHCCRDRRARRYGPRAHRRSRAKRCCRRRSIR